MTVRRRTRRSHRCLRLLCAMGAAAIAGCAFGIALTAILRAGRKASAYQESLIGRAHEAAKFAERVLIGEPIPKNFTETGEDSKDIKPRKGNCSVSEVLWEEVKVLCWVMTRPANHESKAAAVKETWGRRCNSLFFMSSKGDNRLPAVALDVPEGRGNLWSKTRAAFSYLHAKGYLDDKVDWVLKADDDTFVVMENLRYFLTQFDPQETIYVGLRFKKHLKAGFMSGGTGYVLSRKAAKRFVTEALPGNNSCRNQSEHYEDVEMGRCMAVLKARFLDTIASDGKHRSFPYQPEKHLSIKNDQKMKWLRDYLYAPMKKGEDCCSRTAISFHYVSPDRMREMYYLIYSLTPFGIRKLDDERDHVTHDYNTTDDVLDTDAC